MGKLAILAAAAAILYVGGAAACEWSKQSVKADTGSVVASAPVASSGGPQTQAPERR